MAQKYRIPQTFLLKRPYIPSDAARAKDIIKGSSATSKWLVSIIYGSISVLFTNPLRLYIVYVVEEIKSNIGVVKIFMLLKEKERL